MTHLTLEAKEAIVVRALSHRDISLQQIAAESNIGYSTLQRWLQRKREGLPFSGGRRGRPFKGQSQTPPLAHLLATANLDEHGIGAYCREQGIYSFQLKQWREALMKNNGNTNQPTQESAEIKALRDEIKRLKKDLHRKDKALAETSALLILKKKADLIWGEHGED